MPTYTLFGATVEVAKGGQSAKVTRAQVKDDAGQVIQSAAYREFRVLGYPNAPTPQVQAERWVHSLPPVIEDVQLAEIFEPAEAATDEGTEIDDA